MKDYKGELDPEFVKKIMTSRIGEPGSLQSNLILNSSTTDKVAASLQKELIKT